MDFITPFMDKFRKDPRETPYPSHHLHENNNDQQALLQQLQHRHSRPEDEQHQQSMMNQQRLREQQEREQLEKADVMFFEKNNPIGDHLVYNKKGTLIVRQTSMMHALRNRFTKYKGQYRDNRLANRLLYTPMMRFRARTLGKSGNPRRIIERGYTPDLNPYMPHAVHITIPGHHFDQFWITRPGSPDWYQALVNQIALAIHSEREFDLIDMTTNRDIKDFSVSELVALPRGTIHVVFDDNTSGVIVDTNVIGADGHPKEEKSSAVVAAGLLDPSSRHDEKLFDVYSSSSLSGSGRDNRDYEEFVGICLQKLKDIQLQCERSLKELVTDRTLMFQMCSELLSDFVSDKYGVLLGGHSPSLSSSHRGNTDDGYSPSEEFIKTLYVDFIERIKSAYAKTPIQCKECNRVTLQESGICYSCSQKASKQRVSPNKESSSLNESDSPLAQHHPLYDNNSPSMGMYDMGCEYSSSFSMVTTCNTSSQPWVPKKAIEYQMLDDAVFEDIRISHCPQQHAKLGSQFSLRTCFKSMLVKVCPKSSTKNQRPSRTTTSPSADFPYGSTTRGCTDSARLCDLEEDCPHPLDIEISYARHYPSSAAAAAAAAATVDSPTSMANGSARMGSGHRLGLKSLDDIQQLKFKGKITIQEEQNNPIKEYRGSLIDFVSHTRKLNPEYAFYSSSSDDDEDIDGRRDRDESDSDSDDPYGFGVGDYGAKKGRSSSSSKQQVEDNPLFWDDLLTCTTLTPSPSKQRMNAPPPPPQINWRAGSVVSFTELRCGNRNSSKRDSSRGFTNRNTSEDFPVQRQPRRENTRTTGVVLPSVMEIKCEILDTYLPGVTCNRFCEVFLNKNSHILRQVIKSSADGGARNWVLYIPDDKALPESLTKAMNAWADDSLKIFLTKFLCRDDDSQSNIHVSLHQCNSRPSCCFSMGEDAKGYPILRTASMIIPISACGYITLDSKTKIRFVVHGGKPTSFALSS